MTYHHQELIFRRHALVLALLAVTGVATAQDLRPAMQALFSRIEEATRALMQIYSAPGASASTASPATRAQVQALIERLNAQEVEVLALRDQAFAQKNADALRILSDMNKSLEQGRALLAQARLKWSGTPAPAPAPKS